MKQTYIRPLILVLLSGLIFTGCDTTENTLSASVESQIISVEAVPIATPAATESPTPSPEPTPTPYPEKDVTLLMVGDNLMHMGIVYTGRQNDGSYNFDVLYEGIADKLETTDIKIINQETILGGNQLGFSGFPHFNSPTEVGDAIAKSGFNVVLHASNHTADQGIKGINNCLDFWETHPEVALLGITRDTEENNTLYITKEDMTFAILNYTYGPNAETIPSDIRGHMNVLCNYDERGHMDYTTIRPAVLEEIKEADQNADFVIVCPHWGTEYAKTPSSYQEKFAKQMTEAGADVILGTHPHVPQPIEHVIAENGNRSLCYYSLGNYLSTQKNGLSMLEGMAYITFHKTENDCYIDYDRTGVYPIVCQYSSNPVRFKGVYYLNEYTEELAKSHGIHSYGGVNLTLADLQKWSQEIFGDWDISN